MRSISMHLTGSVDKDDQIIASVSGKSGLKEYLNAAGVYIYMTVGVFNDFP